MVQPHLMVVMRSPALYLNPSQTLMQSNATVAGVYVVVVLAILALVHIWLPRNVAPTIRFNAGNRVVLTAAAIFSCTVITTNIYFVGLSPLLGLHSSEFMWPGLYTIAAVGVSLFFIASVWRTNNSSATQAPLPVPPQRAEPPTKRRGFARLFDPDLLDKSNK